MKSRLIKIALIIVIAIPLLALNNTRYQFNEEATPEVETSGGGSISTATHEDFSEETRAIINKQWATENINENNYDKIMAQYGGYDNWVKHLGGVFAEYAGTYNIVEVKTAEDLQKAAEYTWGLMTIFGFDYMSTDNKFHKWGADNKQIRPYAFYTNPNRKWQNHMYDDKAIDLICSKKVRKNGQWIGMRTNCNCGVWSFMKKTTIYKAKKDAEHSGRYKTVSDSEIKVGDLVDFYGRYNSNSEPDKWHHVAIVGEIDSSTGDVILYDSGNRFIRYGRYKWNLKEYEHSYRYHKVRHFMEIDQTTTLGTGNSGSGETIVGGTVGTGEVDQKLVESLRYACSFIGKIKYADKYDKRRFGKLEEGYSDCSHFVHRVFEHTGIMNKFVHSEDWGFGGCPRTKVVAEFKAGKKWDYSNASPRRYTLGTLSQRK